MVVAGTPKGLSFDGRRTKVLSQFTGMVGQAYTGLLVLAAMASVWNCSRVAASAQEPVWDESRAIKLFDGHSLDGWVVKCKPQDDDKRSYWKVEDGTIVAEVPAGSKHDYIWLVTEREFGDFELRLQVQTFSNSTGNSGVQVRSRYDDQAYWMDGPQVDINPPGPWRCGFIYDETRGAQVWLWPDVGRPANARPEHAPAGWKWFHADDPQNPHAWNEVRIICEGLRIRTFVNGVAVADYDGSGRLDDEHHQKRRVGLSGHIALQIHPGGTLHIRFKDIRLLPLDGE